MAQSFEPGDIAQLVGGLGKRFLQCRGSGDILVVETVDKLRGRCPQTDFNSFFVANVERQVQSWNGTEGKDVLTRVLH